MTIIISIFILAVLSSIFSTQDTNHTITKSDGTVTTEKTIALGDTITRKGLGN